MVSWNDGDSSESSAAQYISSSDSPVKIPATIDDPFYSGLDDNMMCEHGKLGKKYVAFEGISTGRRFIACAIEGDSNCGVVEWLDEDWPDQLQNALHKQWLMYEESQHCNRIACLEHSTIVHNLTEQKKKLRVTYEKLVEDVNNLLDSQDNLPQPHTSIGDLNDGQDHLKNHGEENNTIHVDKSNGGDLNEELVVKDAEITKLKDATSLP